jgi:glucose dehydrogenase
MIVNALVEDDKLFLLFYCHALVVVGAKLASTGGSWYFE